jgi:hypothetical protein
VKTAVLQGPIEEPRQAAKQAEVPNFITTGNFADQVKEKEFLGRVRQPDDPAEPREKAKGQQVSHVSGKMNRGWA